MEKIGNLANSSEGNIFGRLRVPKIEKQNRKKRKSTKKKARIVFGSFEKLYGSDKNDPKSKYVPSLFSFLEHAPLLNHPLHFTFLE